MQPRPWLNSLLRAAAAALGLAVFAAAAQTRAIPDFAQRGYVSHVTGAQVVVEGQPMLLSPGALIRGQNNLLIQPAAMPAGSVLADFVVDGNGQVARIWILTEAEASQPRLPRAATGAPIVTDRVFPPPADASSRGR